MAATPLIEKANRAREGKTKTSAFDLWRLADGATRTTEARVIVFRHAMIHAGFIVDMETAVPYATCPVCQETLGRAV